MTLPRMWVESDITRATLCAQRRMCSRFVAVLLGLVGPFALTACGGSTGTTSSPPAARLTGTLAYVVSECRQNTSGYVLHQAVQTRQGDREPITVMEVPDIEPAPAVSGLCKFTSSSRYGPNIISQGAVQRIAISEDGSMVAFELTDDFSLLGHSFLSADQKGIFVGGADGTGVRRLGPPSQQSSSLLSPPSFLYFNDLQFSPDGRALVFPDNGPGPDGTESSQVLIQDVATGTRMPITDLPPATPGPDVVPGFAGVCCPAFLNDVTIGFLTDANVNGSNPAGHVVGAEVKTDGSDLKVPPVVALPGNQINPTFIITGDRPVALSLQIPGELVREVFLVDGDNLLQLTNFHRADTQGRIGVDRQTVFITAAANPFGGNPSANCQIFSIDRTGTNLRQLTHFVEATRSINGCEFDLPVGTGCAIQLIGQDATTQTLLFYSSCDPLGTNPKGGQIFAMRSDGSDLHQLTNTRGLITEPDGTVTGEFPGPFAFSSNLL
jgi:hypothetical protein